MRWDIEDKVACELWFFTGLSFGGTRSVVRVAAYGGLQKHTARGDEVRSMGIICEPGIRVILMTARSPLAWEDSPWRAFQMLEGEHHTLQDGRSALQVPDLDRYDPYTANRTDPDLEADFPQVETLAAGTGWTFGRSGRRGIKNRIQAVRIERIPDPG
jgi:hypothetical protein